MKFLAPLFLLCFSASVAHASADDSLPPRHKSKIEHQLFINTTYFIKQIVSLSNSSLAISPYIVGYKCFFTKHDGIRVSVGGSISNSKQFPDSTFVTITKSGAVNGRVGYEYRKQFGKFWSFFTGADIVCDYSYNNTRVNSDDDIVTTNTNSWDIGGGPIAGIQFNIGKRIALFTETAFYYTYGKTNQSTTSFNFPALNENKTTAINQTGQFLLPTSVYFVFKF